MAIGAEDIRYWRTRIQFSNKMLELEHLKQLVLRDDFDAESRQEVARLEARLAKAAQAEKIASLPTIKDFIEYMQFQKDAAEQLLKTDRTMTDRERDKMFERIDLTTRFIALFTGQERNAVEEEINSLLDVANSYQ